ncbi:Hypp2244 [Branchiostoma lanceolatum]|uniref:Hypp2244 protein n=1 Tax=Branchiostoma lanceolatum TaxID=7740 RepID=A0A8J9ZSG1_BRALA|nr:Hypp2244 [Branchiostoma lanceolatum]
MDVFTVAAAIAIATLSAVVIVVYFLHTTQSSPWPKTKQRLAYTRKVIPKKRRLPLKTAEDLLNNSLDDFLPTDEETTVKDVAKFFARRGNEFSVYSIDWEQEVVVLIRPVDGVDLKSHPFFRQAQRRNAAEVLCVPLEQLQEVASAVADKVAHVQEVFIFMTGRCGSTLVTRLVEATSMAQAVSEPDVFSVICLALHRLKRSSQHGQTPSHHGCSAVLSNEESTIALLRNVVTLMNYNLVTSDPRHRDVIFYKHRVETILFADLLARAVPSAKTVFMYRNGLEVTESFSRAFVQQSYVLYKVLRWGTMHIALLLPDTGVFEDDPKFSTVRQRGKGLFDLCALWVGTMQCAADLQKRQPGHFFHAVVYYSALLNDKKKTFLLMMKKLGLKWSPEKAGEDTDKIDKALVEDSQAGSSLCANARKPGEKWAPDVSSRWIGQWEREYFREVCRCTGDEIPGPDFLLPGTIV